MPTSSRTTTAVSLTRSTVAAPLDLGLRAAARVALYTGLFIVALVSAGLLPIARGFVRVHVDDSWRAVDYPALPEVELLRALLAVDTSPAGDEGALAELIAHRFAAVGVASEIERLPGGKANLWAVIEGEERRALVLHSHLDVEPAPQPERWKFPPFAAAIDGPWLYGRGAFDMKSVTAAQVFTLIELKRRLDQSGERLPFSLVFLATSSEETGSELGTQWVMAQHPELVQRFWAVLTEGGVLEMTDRDAVKYWGHTFGQKTFVTVWACGSSRQRLDELASDLRAHAAERAVVERTPEVDAFLAGYAATRQDPVFLAALADPERLRREAWMYDHLSPFVRSLLRDEIAVSDPVENSDGSFALRIILHLLPGSSLDQAIAELMPPWLTWGVAWSAVAPRQPARPSSPLSHPVLAAIERGIADAYGDAPQGPYFLTYYSNDGRFFRAAGVPAYGFTPFRFFATDSFTMANVNERIALPAFVDGVVLYRQVVERVFGLPPAAAGPPAGQPAPGGARQRARRFLSIPAEKPRN